LSNKGRRPGINPQAYVRHLGFYLIMGIIQQQKKIIFDDIKEVFLAE
jgi:hypothetical protein